VGGGKNKMRMPVSISTSNLSNMDPSFECLEITKELRAYVLTRDNGLCQMCGKQGYHIHHIIYKSLGGKNTANNLITLCEEHHTSNEGIHGKLGNMKALLQNKVESNERRLRKKLNNSYTKRIL
jgi:5-methylcytosine-specific restriction endonuclease McrA